MFPQRICHNLGLGWFSCWTWKVFPQRICWNLGLGWCRFNLQYIQGSGQLLLKLPVFRTMAPPHLHPSHGHRDFSSRGRCLATLTTKTHILKSRKAMAGRAGCFQGTKGTLDTPSWNPAPPASPCWVCSFLLLGACQWGALKTPQAGVDNGHAGCQGTQDPAAGQCSVDKGQPHWMVRPCLFRTPSPDPGWWCCCPQCSPGFQEVDLLPREWQRPVPQSQCRVSRECAWVSQGPCEE